MERMLLQGDSSFLPPPKETESQTWGEFLDSVFFVYLGGGKKDESPCSRAIPSSSAKSSTRRASRL